MKHLALLSYCVPLVAGAAVTAPQKVSYDGYKVFRVAVGDQVARINDVVSSLGLATWKGAPRAGAFADIVVPPTQINAFADKIVGLHSVTMHEDLGASIAEESSFHAYAGMCCPSIIMPTDPWTLKIDMLHQPDQRIARGLTRTMRTPTMSSS